MNLSTVIVLAILAACVWLSVRSLRKKGMCGCKEHCGGSCASGCSSCSACSAAERMSADMAARADAEHASSSCTPLPRSASRIDA